MFSGGIAPGHTFVRRHLFILRNEWYILRGAEGGADPDVFMHGFEGEACRLSGLRRRIPVPDGSARSGGEERGWKQL